MDGRKSLEWFSGESRPRRKIELMERETLPTDEELAEK